MRYIDFASFTPSQAWRDRAARATAELEQCADHTSRMAYIDAHAAIWRDLKEELLAKFGSRCWFTDAEETVAPLDVEHFRPKAKSVETDGSVYEGYWYLAFSLSNLRLAGQTPNRVHKRCYFPLQKLSFRATSLHRQWQEEIPIFLDPIKLTDVDLVGYDESGQMRPSLSASTAADEERVEVTDRLLGLSTVQPLREARQRIWSDCQNIIAEILKLKEEERQHEQTARTRGERERLMQELRKKTLSTKPFASVAKSCLQMSPHSWAQKLIAA